MAVMPLVMVAGTRTSTVRRSVLASAMRLSHGRMLSTAVARVATPRASVLRATVGVRAFSTTPLARNTAPRTAEQHRVIAAYEGPLARTFTRLKLFSLGSLGLASVLTPILLLAPGEISMAGRVGLCITALATSGVSTALIAWIGTPYVGSMRLLRPSPSPSSSDAGAAAAAEKVVMELNTVSWRLRPTRTLVYEPTFLRPTSRPFAAWEITNSPPALQLTEAQAPVHKKVAETFDVKSGTSLGSWIVKYDDGAKTKAQDGLWKTEGKVEVNGKPTRYFNVHEELLDENWQVLG